MKPTTLLVHWLRKLLYREPSREIHYHDQSGKLTVARPISTCGLMLIVMHDGGHCMIGMSQALRRSEFLRSWYALGGELAMLEGGGWVGPEDVA